LITSPVYVVIKAADRFHTQTTRPNEMWQTDFTYFRMIGWGWMYLSTVLDVLALHHRLEAVQHDASRGRHRHVRPGTGGSGCDHANVHHKPRLLSDNGPSYIAGELADHIEARAWTM
jgi:putative transposase